MIQTRRTQFNQAFSSEKHIALLEEVKAEFGHAVPFRISESPAFLSDALKKELLEASEKIIDLICLPEFEELSKPAVPEVFKHCNNIGEPTCMAIDFAIVKDKDGQVGCKLIELQAALGLYGFTEMIADKYQEFYPEIAEMSPYLSNLDRHSYKEILQKVFLKGNAPEHVVFLEITPEKQQNRIDHLYLERELGIPTIGVSEIIKEGKQLFYRRNGQKKQIHCIVNRVIMEELWQHPDLLEHFSFEEDYQVQWVNHPAWFFKISKFLMPYIQGENFPACFFLDQIDPESIDLENKVLKPIFSLGGKEVRFNVSQEDIATIKEKDQYILQEKVEYDFCIETDTAPVKTEIRIMYVWEEGKERPIPVITFSRFARGNQMALRYTKNEPWGGASTSFFEKG